MKSVVVVNSLCALVFASAGATTAESRSKTFVYPKGRHRHVVTCYIASAPRECYAGWVPEDFGRWAERLTPRMWITGFESLRPDHADGAAHRRTPHLWYVGSRSQRIQFHSRGRWAIYVGKSLSG